MAIWPSRNISDCSHFLILVSIRSALLTNIKFGEGWSHVTQPDVEFGIMCTPSKDTRRELEFGIM